MPTATAVNCDRYREAASARLDGEPIGLSASALDAHMRTCSGCGSWLEAVTTLGRGMRVTGQLPPDLTQAVVGAVVLPAARVRRYRRRLRAALTVLGVIQWGLALSSMLGDSMGMVMSEHGAHESAAWNLAVGAAFLAVAVKPARAMGSLPVLVTFVVTLAVLSIPDIAAGQVTGTRLASHIAIVAGLGVTALVARSQRLLVPPGQPAAGQARVLGSPRRRGAA